MQYSTTALDAKTMTLWPHQEQADQDMWAEYEQRTARPSLLAEKAAAAEAAKQAEQPSTETPPRRGRVSENPQPEKDA